MSLGQAQAEDENNEEEDGLADLQIVSPHDKLLARQGDRTRRAAVFKTAPQDLTRLLPGSRLAEDHLPGTVILQPE
jgi:hypothetical protein